MGFEEEDAPPPQISQKERRFQKLNNCFFKFVQRHIVDNPSSNWSIAMGDYIEHAKKLEANNDAYAASGSSPDPALALTPPIKSSSIPPDLEEHVYDKLDGFKAVHITLAKMYKFVNWIEGTPPKWVSFGRGYLQVFSSDCKSEKVRILLVRDDATKKINLNTNIENSGPVKTTCERAGKKDVVMKGVVFAQKEDDEGNIHRGLGQIMFRVKNSTAADLLHSVIKQYAEA